jgi:CHAD domain-containing protein
MEESAKTTAAADDEPLVDATAAVPVTPELASPAEASPRPDPQDPWKKVRKLALKQLDRFISLEPKVLRGDDADAIHDLRVASRRLQQVLDLLYPAPRHGEVRKLRRRIRRSRRALGEVRNCDVQLARVGRILARKRAPRREAWEAVRHYLLQRRSESFDAASRKLGKLNLAAFYVRLRDLLAPSGHPSPPPARHHHGGPEPTTPELFRERVAGSLERAWQAFEAQVEHSHRDPQVGVIHRVRIAAKRLRYLIEVIHAFGVEGSAGALAWLRGLQEHLGDWHDCEVLEQMMIEMIARPDYLREHLDIAMGVERLILRNRAGKTRFRQKFFQMTGDADEYRQVKKWVAGLLADRNGRV